MVRRDRATSLVAVLLLAALAATIAGPIAHTDDGCAVERHCKACRVALASAGASPPEVPQLAVSDAVETVTAEVAAALRAVPLAGEPCRGPPPAR